MPIHDWGAIDFSYLQPLQPVKDPTTKHSMADFAKAVNFNILILLSTELTSTTDYFSHIHVRHDHQTDSEHPSTSPTSTQEQEKEQEQTPEATATVTRALCTLDILTLVIWEAPLRSRASFRQVSRLWKDAVDRATLKPVSYDCWKSEVVPSVPIYRIDQDDGELRLNRYSGLTRRMLRPKITRTKGLARAHTPIEPRRIVLRLNDLEMLIMHEHEFMTHPAITQALVCAHSKSFVGSRSIEEQVAILRMPGGIRIRDLVECFEKFGLSRDYHGYYVRFAWQR
jgi:hypothetical protein